MAKKATTTFVPETLEPRIYEIGFLLSPAVRDEDLAARVSEFKESLTQLGASFISEGNPEFIDLAYEMSKIIENKRVRFTQGYFGWVKIEFNPAQMVALKEFLDTNILIIRYLLIIAPRENTIISKRPIGRILKGERSEETVEGENPIEGSADQTEDIQDISPEKVEEALDQEIKELVKEA